MEQRVRSKGIMRSRLAELGSLKGRKKTPNKRFSKAALRKLIEEDGVKSDLLSDETKPSLIELSDWHEPAWMAAYRHCTQMLRSVDLLQGEITREQLKKMSSANEQKHDRVIQQFVDQAAIKLTGCEKTLKQMQSAATFQAEMSPTQRKNFTSMLMSLALNIREQARKLRAQQQAEYHREQQLSRSTNGPPLTPKSESYSQTENWLSQQQFEDMEQGMLKERDQEVTKILKSIYGLNSIYKDLQGLVIEQGSLLDRIDEHIGQAVQSVKQARKHLQEAKEQQNSVCLHRCRRLLLGLIVLLAVVLLFKHI